MIHEMIRVQGVWECLSCPYRFVFGADRLPVVLTKGKNVSHFGRVGDAPVLAMRRS